MKRIQIISAFVFTAFFLLFNSDKTSAQEGSTDLPSVGESSVNIVNRGNIRLSYRIRPTGGAWTEYSIGSTETKKIVCNGCSTNTFDFVIGTNGVSKEYTLNSTEHYSINWDSSSASWVVYHETN